MFCEHCEKEFKQSKKTARFCSSTCRTKEWLKNNGRSSNAANSLTESLRGVISENNISDDDNSSEQVYLDDELSETPESDKDEIQNILNLSDIIMPIKKEIEKIDNELLYAYTQKKALEKLFKILWFEMDIRAILRNKTFRAKKGDEIFDHFMKTLIPYHIFPFSESTMYNLLGEGQLVDYSILCKKIKDKKIKLTRYLDECNVKISELKTEIGKQISENKKANGTSVKSDNSECIPDNVTTAVTLKNNVKPDDETEKTELCSIISNPIISDKVITSQQLADMKHKSFNFTGKCKEFLGQPEIDFHCAVYGMAGQGKSTHVIKFAIYLAESFGRVLYIAGEEGFRKTIKDKFLQNEAMHQNLHIADIRTYDDIIREIPNDDKGYHFIIIDSLDNMRIDALKLKQLREHYKDSAFITISQCTKAGKMRGSYEIIHDADIEIEIINGIAFTKKNRFHINHLEFRIFD